jgi:hypothetical protein
MAAHCEIASFDCTEPPPIASPSIRCAFMTAQSSSQDRALTWASLLAHWAEFAAASRGLPATSEGTRWKRAVPEIIGLQAVTFALAEAHELPVEEFALAQDRAEILIRGHAKALGELWHAEPLPMQLDELIRDARSALAATRQCGVEFRVISERVVCEHPAELAATLASIDHPAGADAHESAGFGGDLFIASPGVAMMQTAPVAFVRGPRGRRVDDDVLAMIRVFLGGKREVDGPHRVPGFRQVYRQFDFGRPGTGHGAGWGGPVRDCIAAREEMILPGQPLLVPVILASVVQPVPMAIRGMDQIESLPVVVERGES